MQKHVKKEDLPPWRPVPGKPHLLQDPDGRLMTNIDPYTKKPLPPPEYKKKEDVA